MFSFSFLETDAADPEPGVLHHHGRGSGHPGRAQEQLRDPDHAAEAGHLAPPGPTPSAASARSATPRTRRTAYDTPGTEGVTV